MMATHWSDAQIETFVRTTLGCGCPDRVFEKIELGGLTLPGNTHPLTRLVIGDTLLIYLVYPGGDQLVAESALQVAESGRDDRDRNGYNRFRLVLAEPAMPPAEDPLATRFATHFAGDEKMHLHRVAAASVAGLLVDAPTRP